MSTGEYKGLEFKDAMNVIKQKPLTGPGAVDAEDVQFLKARADYLTEMEKAIYFKGVLPEEAAKEGGVFRSANDRIIHENRSLQEAQQVLRAADVAATRAAAEAMQPLTVSQKDEASKERTKAFKNTMAGLNASAEAMTKDNEKVAKERTAREEKAKKDAMKDEKDSKNVKNK